MMKKNSLSEKIFESVFKTETIWFIAFDLLKEQSKLKKENFFVSPISQEKLLLTYLFIIFFQTKKIKLRR